MGRDAPGSCSCSHVKRNKPLRRIYSQFFLVSTCIKEDEKEAFKSSGGELF
jgi:hypothetical protein